jgi:hypothetical protein
VIDDEIRSDTGAQMASENSPHFGLFRNAFDLDVTKTSSQRPVTSRFRAQRGCNLIAAGAELLMASPEAMALLGQYSTKNILGPKFQNDMLHIALATIADVDVLVSWNFRHIVRLDKIRLFNAVNIECGYKPLTICSPREVVPDETKE